MPLNADNCMQNVKKKSKFYFGIFLSFRWKNAYISLTLVYYSVKSLFLARLYESMESYCYHFGLGIDVTLLGFTSKFLTNHWPETFYI